MYWTVKNEVLTPGDGLRCPHFHARCTILVSDVICKFVNDVKLEEKNFVFGCEMDFEVEIALEFGEGDISTVIDDCLQKMKIGEMQKVSVDVLKEYGSLMPGDFISFVLKLVSFKQERVLYDLQADECIDVAQRLKDTGTRLFKESRIHVAACFYIKALKHLIILSSLNEPLEEISETLIVNCYSNLAACQLKLKQHDNVVENCSNALQHDKHHLKSLYRRATARLTLGEFDKAENDIAIGLRIDTNNKQFLSLKANIHRERCLEDQDLAKKLSVMFKPHSFQK